MIKIVENPIDCSEVLQSVYRDDCGANLLFTGTTRNITGDTETKYLIYDCYQEMAISEMNSLCDQAKAKWPVKEISVVHRMGRVDIGEVSIAVAISGQHRGETFSAGQWIIDELKKKVPIWKQENGVDGSKKWVHPGVDLSKAKSR